MDRNRDRGGGGDRDRGGERDRDGGGDRGEWKGDREEGGSERVLMREERGVKAGRGLREEKNKDVTEVEEGDGRDDQLGEREKRLEGEEGRRDESKREKEEEGEREGEEEGDGKGDYEGDIECSQWAASQIIEVPYVISHHITLCSLTSQGQHVITD